MFKRFASRAVPPATLAHEQKEWDGTGGQREKILVSVSRLAYSCVSIPLPQHTPAIAP